MITRRGIAQYHNKMESPAKKEGGNAIKKKKKKKKKKTSELYGRGKKRFGRISLQQKDPKKARQEKAIFIEEKKGRRWAAKGESQLSAGFKGGGRERGGINNLSTPIPGGEKYQVPTDAC